MKMHQLMMLSLGCLIAVGCGPSDAGQEEPLVVISDDDPDAGDNSDETDGGESESDSGGGEEEPSGLAVLGGGTHSLEGLELTVIATTDDRLARPTDLAFNPEADGQLWIVNQADDSVVIIHDAGTEQQNSERYAGGNNVHFLANPAALAFGEPGTMATAQQEDMVTQPQTPADYMGPTLWSTDLAVFDGGHGGHLDMMHNSPDSSGIAWDQDNVYFVFDGYHDAIAKYDFVDDHGPGGTDHSDGIVRRYVDGDVSDVEGFVSHLDFDRDSALLFIADTGNNRIVTLDPESGDLGGPIRPNYDGSDQRFVTGATLETLVDGAEAGLEAPSGLEVRDGTVFVGDAEQSRIFAFSTDGELVDHLDLTGEIDAGGLAGLAFDQTGRLWIADAAGDRVLRIAARE